MERVIQFIEIGCFMWAAHSILMAVYKYIQDKFKINLNIPSFISCSKCFTFWLVLICSFDALLAGVASAEVCLLGSIISYLNSNSKIQLNG